MLLSGIPKLSRIRTSAPRTCPTLQNEIGTLLHSYKLRISSSDPATARCSMRCCLPALPLASWQLFRHSKQLLRHHQLEGQLHQQLVLLKLCRNHSQQVNVAGA